LPNLDKLVVLGNHATASPYFDDFYLAKGAYLSTVPRPFEFTGQSGPLPALQIRWVGTQIEITWTRGVLQETTTLGGQWNDVPGVSSPYVFTPGPGAKFYRARP
jgi:hypothetical protein